MKIIKYIEFVLSFVILLFVTNLQAHSQDTRTLLATAIIKDIKQINIDTIQFSIYLQRNSESWNKFANATFEIAFNDTVINNQSVGIELLPGSSQLHDSLMVGTTPSDYSYYIFPMVRPGRLVITIWGPKKYVYSDTIQGDSILIGTFQVYSIPPGNPISDSIHWVEPWYESQAIAIKLENDSIIRDQIIYAYPDDNIEMDDSSLTRVVFSNEGTYTPRATKVKYFIANYMGFPNVELKWATISESYNKGFKILRGELPYGETDINKVDYNYLITDVNQNPSDSGWYESYDHLADTSVNIALDSSQYKYKYQHDYDSTIQFMGQVYCYELLYYNYLKGDTIELAKTSITIPNSAIIFTRVTQNPFSSSTSIKYALDVEAYLDCIVYDLNGNIVTRLCNHQHVDKYNGSDTSTVTFNASPYAQQGLYNVVFIATPVNDPGIEFLRAVVKLDLIR